MKKKSLKSNSLEENIPTPNENFTVKAIVNNESVKFWMQDENENPVDMDNWWVVSSHPGINLGYITENHATHKATFHAYDEEGIGTIYCSLGDSTFNFNPVLIYGLVSILRIYSERKKLASMTTRIVTSETINLLRNSSRWPTTLIGKSPLETASGSVSLTLTNSF